MYLPVNTHVHADHITGSGLLRKITGCKTAIGKFTGAKTTDIYLADGDEIEYGAQVSESQFNFQTQASVLVLQNDNCKHYWNKVSSY